MHILVVEDGTSTVARGVALLASPMVRFTTTDCEKALRVALDDEFDAVVLDTGQDAASTDVVQRLRLNKLRLPILLLAPTNRLVEVVRALSAGADDYMTLPADPDGVLKRVLELTREHAARVRPVLRLGILKIDLDRKTVHADGVRISLTNKEFQVLELLAVRQGTIVTKSQLLAHLYSDTYEPVAKIIDVFVCKLRAKLLAYTKLHYIATDWGRGYVLRVPEHYSENESVALRA